VASMGFRAETCLQGPDRGAGIRIPELDTLLYRVAF
jgi:hypothetical protein